MLTPIEMDGLFDHLGTPYKGRKLVLDARLNAPVREVKSRGKNIITFFASHKMAREIATESRTAEYAATLAYELDDEVLEYYPQPCTLKLELIDPETGEVHPVDHTPDFLVIKGRQITLQEWKTEEKLMHLARHVPWRYEKQGSQWRSPQIEEQVVRLGIAYEVHSNAEIHPNRTKNLEILEEYLHAGAPSCSQKILEKLHAALVEHGRLSIRDLLGAGFDFQADEINSAIVQGHLTCNLDSALLSSPDDFLVYRDSALMTFPQAGLTENSALPENSFALTLAPGVCFRYDGQTLKIELLGGRDVVCRILEEEKTITLSTDWLLNALSSGELTHVNGPATDGLDLHPLVHYSAVALEEAQRRAHLLTMPYDPATAPFSHRTYFRLQSEQSAAVINGSHEILALAPRHADKGNRTQRLSEEQIYAMESVRKSFYVTTRAPNAKAAHRELQSHCERESIVCPSYPTFRKYLQAGENDATRRVRYGKRLAYQKGALYYNLAYDTPRHGVRPFECVHIDHTLLDIELKCRRTGLSLGRPWLSLMVDAYSRRVMAMHLGFQTPDRSAVLMCLRDFVKRWNRLPQMLMTDNGKDLIAQDVKHFLTSMGVHFRLRPAGQPRAGAVMERMFGTLNKQLIHNLDGNTELTRNVRSLTGSHLPKHLANWNLENIYSVLEYWAYQFYDQRVHPALDLSPREAFERARRETGKRAHRVIAYNRDFLIATCPTVDRSGERTIDRQRGVKVNNFYYQSPHFDSLLLAKKKFPVRYDPHDVGRVFVQMPNREWVDAHCMLLRHLPRMNVRQLEAVSAEYLKTHSRRIDRHDAISGTHLLEFISTMSPNAEILRQAQMLGETEFLHEKLGLIDTQPGDVRPKVFGMEPLRDFALAQSSGHDLIKKAPPKKVTIGTAQHRRHNKKDTDDTVAYQTDVYGDLD